ncbi:HNH endonuclease family protein [uncultured Leifsonia sp.]|uniref:HNH endonuclease family protein n=1 Tax=uncultured Leifsonia sp. TaxID=340359 RepID=UPI0028D2517B|nr:HNH endonuclease family protein [uncultured Leifsonia sp.]
MRDSVLALRRFGLESSYPLILAAFATWQSDGGKKAAKLFIKVTNWSIRALFAGRLGGSVAEKAFSNAAKMVSEGKANNQDEVKSALASLMVEDPEFTTDFKRYGNVTVPRAKYLLAMLERAHRAKNGESIEGLPDWASRTVTIEHLMPRAEAKNDESKLGFAETLPNMALLEKSLNRNLEDKPFVEKTSEYAKSAFRTTSELASRESWTKDDVEKRMQELARLAPMAWPA